MGPRLFRRGNWWECWGSSSRPRCFNGATSFQTWKSRTRQPKPSTQRCFNGATSFQTWKYQGLLSVLEALDASMGPRLFRRGNQTGGSSLSQATICFNGATSFQTWKSISSTVCNSSAKISLQWGHVFSDVEIGLLRTLKMVKNLLQWGHVFSDVEIAAIFQALLILKKWPFSRGRFSSPILSSSRLDSASTFDIKLHFERFPGFWSPPDLSLAVRRRSPSGRSSQGELPETQSFGRPLPLKVPGL